MTANCILRNSSVKDEAAAFRERFTTMGYCLPAGEAAELSARVLASAFPKSDYAKLFAENLMKFA